MDGGVTCLQYGGDPQLPCAPCGILAVETSRVLNRGGRSLSRYVSPNQLNAVEPSQSQSDRREKPCLNSIHQTIRLLVLIDSPKRHHEERLKPYPAQTGVRRPAARSRDTSATKERGRSRECRLRQWISTTPRVQPVDQPFAHPAGWLFSEIQRRDRWMESLEHSVSHQAAMGALHGTERICTAPPRYPDNRSGRRRNEHGRLEVDARQHGTWPMRSS